MGGNLMSPSKQDPQRDRQCFMVLQDDMPFNALGKVGNQFAGVDRFGPRLDDPMTKQWRRAFFSCPLGAACADLIVQRAATNPKLIGRFGATAVVLNIVKTGQFVD